MQMGFWVYLLRCADGSYYVGHTDHIEKRMAEHGRGAIPGYTTRRRPVVLVFSEEFPTRGEALERERQIKKWSRAKKEALTRYDWAELSRLAGGTHLVRYTHHRLRQACPERSRRDQGERM